MRFGVLVLVLLAGCEHLFGLRSVPPPADGSAVDAADAAGSGSDTLMLIQQITKENNATGLDVTLMTKPNPGNMLVLIGGAECGLSTVSGGGVSVWQVAAYSGVSPTISVYYGISDGTSPIVHLTPQCSSKTWGLVTEWSGIATANTVDDHNNIGMSGGGSSAGDINMSVSPNSAPDLLLFGVACYGTIGNAGTGWKELQPVVASSTVSQRVWYQVATTTGPQMVSVTFSNDWDAAIVALRTGP